MWPVPVLNDAALEILLCIGAALGDGAAIFAAVFKTVCNKHETTHLINVLVISFEKQVGTCAILKVVFFYHIL